MKSIALASLLLAGVGATLLRVARLDGYITYYPDTYAQLRGVDNLLAGDFPISYIYPPGIATALTPAFLLLPDSLAALETAILLAGFSLIFVAFALARAWAEDSATAWLLAVAVAFASPFVFFSRVLWFDGINTLLIALSLLLAPSMPRRSIPAQVAYGVLIFAAVTVRYTNLLLLPVLLLASLPERDLSVGAVMRHLRSRMIIVAAVTICVLYGAYLISAWDAIGRFSNGTSGSVLGTRGYAERFAQYVAATILGYSENLGPRDSAAVAVVGILAVGGAVRLWRLSQTRSVALLLLVTTWAPVHAFYVAYDDRYVLPAFFVVLFLAAYGLSAVPRWWRTLERPWARVGVVTGLALGLAFFSGQHLATDISYLLLWPEQIRQSREPAYEVIRQELRRMDGEDSVVISSQALAIDRANQGVRVYDLIPHSGSYGIDDESVERLVVYVGEQEAAGKTVYYHYTEYEEVGSRFLVYEEGFDAYFEGLMDRYRMREIVSDDVRVQRLYRLEPLTSDGDPAHHR